jgi:hypothetical protein
MSWYLVGAVHAGSIFVDSEFFERDEDNAPIVDADDLALIEHIRDHGCATIGQEPTFPGTLRGYEPARSRTAKDWEGWPERPAPKARPTVRWEPNPERPSHYEPSWKREDRLLRVYRHVARIEKKEQREALAKKIEHEKRRQLALEKRREQEPVPIPNQNVLAAELTRKRIADMKAAIMRIMQYTHPMVWTVEQLMTAVDCLDRDFVTGVCEEMARDGQIRK